MELHFISQTIGLILIHIYISKNIANSKDKDKTTRKYTTVVLFKNYKKINITIDNQHISIKKNISSTTDIKTIAI